MILSGIIDTTLGGFTVIRGFARLGDLERHSVTNPEYQRNLIDEHKEGIKRFLSEQKFLFFPEVILSVSLNLKKKTTVDLLEKGFSSSSNVDGLSLKVVKAKLPQNTTLSSGKGAPSLAYLTLPDEFKLFRIDGNHRLSAVEGSVDTATMYILSTPYCIVLHQEPSEAERFEKVVFHDINSKQRPLTSEENLKLILQEGGSALFSDQNLLDVSSFGLSYLMARKLIPKFNSEFLAGLAKLFENRYTLALSLSSFLIDREESFKKTDQSNLDEQVSRIRDALKTLNNIYENPSYIRLQESASQSILVAFVYFALKDEGKHHLSFIRWIMSNRIDRLASVSGLQAQGGFYHSGRNQALDAANIIDVFESILSARRREIFVSMEFSTNTNSVYEAIQEAIAQVNQKHRLQADLTLKPIRIDRTNKGHSFTIPDGILQAIDGCGLLIADLTQSNKNVYHEVGFLMGLNQGRGEPHENFILIVDAQQAEDATVGFNLRPWHQVRFTDTLGLSKDLVISLEEHYGLRVNDSD